MFIRLVYKIKKKLKSNTEKKNTYKFKTFTRPVILKAPINGYHRN